MVDEALGARVRAALEDHLAGLGHAGADDEHAVTEKRMFGGLAFLLGGRMAVVVSTRSGGLMVRVPLEERGALLAGAGVRPMRMRGSDLRGWVVVDTAELADDDVLRHWVEVGVRTAAAAPVR
ncbi:TfoX/Sxy family protein [Cellulomonas palmilytica]|uniref:TfoX/Sxy family protein n=1 Tax=Cellulomonas palmilytica TaxID=2608402 RepID=UPI001F2BC3A4|nr:TfoX/Sxy family protein [Cellulomonas palmilytica]UJP41644.1 TfoX/Sxy family protein [Cellulomonas palmilytica]